MCICSSAVSNTPRSTWRNLLPTVGAEICLFLQPLWHLITLSLRHGQLPAHPFPGLVSASHLASFCHHLITAEVIFQDWVATIFPLLLTVSPSQHNWMSIAPLHALSEADAPTANGWDTLKGATSLFPKRGRLETRHPATGATTSRVNTLPPRTLLANGGREGLAKQAATLTAPVKGRDDTVGFHPRMLHRESARKKGKEK